MHADILEFLADQSEAKQENPHVVLRARFVEGSLVLCAGALRVFGEGGDGEAENNVTFDLSSMGGTIKTAHFPAWVVPLKARTSTVPVRHTLFRLIAWYRMES